WDPERSQVVIEAQEMVDEEDLDAPEPAVLRVRISAGAARAFTRRALEVVAAGRPPCPLCGQPLDAKGHVCVRLNGYRGGEAASCPLRRASRPSGPPPPRPWTRRRRSSCSVTAAWRWPGASSKPPT